VCDMHKRENRDQRTENKPLATPGVGESQKKGESRTGAIKQPERRKVSSPNRHAKEMRRGSTTHEIHKKAHGTVLSVINPLAKKARGWGKKVKKKKIDGGVLKEERGEKTHLNSN